MSTPNSSVENDYSSSFLQNALKQDILNKLVTQKANACPMGVRLAWHSAGTYDKSDNSGGTDGATMRFEPESTDDANAGLGIARDMMFPVEQNFPNVSIADIYALCGAAAVENCGGPKIPVGLGRTDDKDGSNCPPNGRLPDASLGADHLREVFYRMGFDDKEIVCLSGAHTLGRCHKTRSGFDGPWTADPLKFDNSYFTNLLNLEWKPREWDGPLQYEDPSGKLMMLPTDLCLIQDEKFLPYVKLYANDSDAFFQDFSAAFAKLLALGCPARVVEGTSAPVQDPASAEFREHAMHGSIDHCKAAVAKGANVSAREANSGRTALHKAAFWGHFHLIDWFLGDLKMDPNVQDYNGDTALHDAARFGHLDVVKAIVSNGGDKTIKNREGKTASDVAAANGKTDVVAILE